VNETCPHCQMTLPIRDAFCPECRRALDEIPAQANAFRKVSASAPGTKRSILLKATTILASVMLVAGYVSYAAGALDGLVGTAPQSVSQEGGSKSGLDGSSTGAPAKAPDPKPAFMSSSKLIVIKIDSTQPADSRKPSKADE
jgi:hypothetical protein